MGGSGLSGERGADLAIDLTKPHRCACCVRETMGGERETEIRRKIEMVTGREKEGVCVCVCVRE